MGAMLSALRYRLWIICVVLTGVPGVVFCADFEAIIRFNTTCAQCHEGQCSGRLSFNLGAEAAFDHIRRYAGDVDDATMQALYDALSQMKTACAFAPLPELALRKPAESSELDRYRNPRTGAYFVPVGMLQPGQYRLELRLSSPVSFRMEIINEFFELVEENCAGPATLNHAVHFRVEETAKTYMRLGSTNNLRLQSLALSPK